MEIGFKELEEIINIGNNRLILVSGRPASGKTHFGINVFNNIVLKQNIPTLFLSLESSKETIINNSAGTLYVDDTANVTLEYIEEQCKKFKQEHNIGFIIIDYLQLINDKDVEIVGARLRTLAEELGLTILVLSQLTGTDKIPTLSDLKESKAIADVSDVVLFLHRETTNADTEIIVAKNEKQIEILDFEDEHLLDTFFDYTATVSAKRTGLNIDIWSKWSASEKSKEQPHIIIGKAEYWNRYIIVVTLSPTPTIIAQTPNITDEQMQDLKAGIEYVARNYDVFLKHYNNAGSGFDDDDLIDALKEKGEYGNAGFIK